MADRQIVGNWVAAGQRWILALTSTGIEMYSRPFGYTGFGATTALTGTWSMVGCSRRSGTSSLYLRWQPDRDRDRWRGLFWFHHRGRPQGWWGQLHRRWHLWCRRVPDSAHDCSASGARPGRRTRLMAVSVALDAPPDGSALRDEWVQLRRVGRMPARGDRAFQAHTGVGDDANTWSPAAYPAG